jgi:hypothetical protein
MSMNTLQYVVKYPAIKKEDKGNFPFIYVKH